MRAYYNEIDPFAVAWLRELIAAGEIAAGDVDDRSLLDVSPADLGGYTQAHFFAGIGGWSLALRLAGWPDSRPIWTGSCPCQPFSTAGAGHGGVDERHLWPAWFDLISRCRPPVVLGEQVEAAIGHGWLDLVWDDLEGIGYTVAPVGVPAACVGSPTIRQRLWFVADTECAEWGALCAARGDGCDGPDSGRQETHGEPGTCGEVRELADAATTRYERRRPIKTRDGRDTTRRESERLCAIDELGSPNSSRLQRRECAELSGTERDNEGRAVGQPSGAWADLQWLPCRDGKQRPAQPGIFPLVARLPGGVVPGGDPSEAEANATAEARVMRLKGYGNSIVPAVAAEFIRAYLAVA